MARYPLEWGWHTDPKNDTDPSDSPDSPPATQQRYPLEWGWDAPAQPGGPALPTFRPVMQTLLGGADPQGVFAKSVLPVKYDGPPAGHQIAQGSPDFPKSSANPQIGDSQDPNSPNWMGFELVLPNGETVPDEDSAESPSRSPTKTVRTPLLNLGEVAAAGRRAQQEMRERAGNKLTIPLAPIGSMYDAFAKVGTGGQFDYQRHGKNGQLLDLLANALGVPGAYEQRRQFLPISNINVGLYSQQSGLTLEQTLERAGWFARHFSGNYKPNQPYGLDRRTARFIEIGYNIGERGLYGHDVEPPP
jgi:hypothetical protein